MIVLDTQAWLLWLHDPNKLSADGRRRIRRETEKDHAVVSAISVWEVAAKVRSGRLALHMELDTWFARARTYQGNQIDPVRPDDAIESTRLPGDFQGDVADRLIVTVARRHGALLVSRDPRIQTYPHVRTIW